MAKIGRPRKYTQAQMQKLIDAYFKRCDDTGKPYTITGLALALDTDRISLIRWAEDHEFCHTVKKAKTRCENYMEQGGATGLVPTAFAIFCLKNYKWTDQQEHVHSGDGVPLKVSIQLDRVNGKERQTTETA